MKGRVLAQVVLGRILLPLSLLAASVLRQNVISLIYLLLLLVVPVVPRRKQQFDGGFRVHILLVLSYSLTVCVAELVFQLYLIIYALTNKEHYGDVLHPVNSTCQLVDTLQFIGFERVDVPIDEAYHVVRLFLPDVVVLLMSLITFGTLRRLYQAPDVCDHAQPAHQSRKVGALKKYVETFGELSVFLLLGVSGAMVPSVISAFYFLTALGILVYWSLHLTFNLKIYTVYKMIVFTYVGLHLVLLYVCQLSFLQTWLDDPDHVFYSRLFGMTPLFTTDCSKPWLVNIANHSWPYFANPIVLFCTFAVMSVDLAYRRDALERARTGSLESSPFRRDDISRTSEHQLLVNEQQPTYDAIQRAETQPIASTSQAFDNIDTAARTPTLKLDTATRVRRIWETLYNAALANSYLLAFFVMLIWAVVYPSWTAFVFLILGCVLWLFPNSHKATLVCSPLLVVYSIALCIIQYVCSINSGGIDYDNSTSSNSTTDLFFNSSGYLMESIGLVGYPYPAVAIMFKLFFTMLFCVVLRDLRRHNCFQGTEGQTERGLCLSRLNSNTDVRGQPEQDSVDGDDHSVDNMNIVILGQTLKTWISKYFIGLFYILLLIMAIQEPYIYRLVYMLFFLYSAITFQLNYRLWRWTLRVYLLIVAVYSIVAIIIVYILSFHKVLVAFQEASGLRDKWLADLGFNVSVNYQENGSAGSLMLLERLIVPALLLVAVMLQIHIFHRTFMQLTDHALLERSMINDEQRAPVSTEGSVRGGFVADFVNLMKRLRPYGHTIFYSICRFITIHMYKVVYIGAVVLVTREATAFGLVLLIILNLSLFFDPVGRLRKGCLLVAQFWVGLVILAKMLFQLQTMPKTLLKNNCTFGNLTYLNYSSANHSYVPEIHDDPGGVKDSASWLGLKSLGKNSTRYEDGLPYYIGGYVLVLVGLTIHAIFKVHDQLRSKVVKYSTGVTFPTINKGNLDDNLRSFVGYVINFAFVKLGLEICYMMTAIVIAYRQDVVGVVYALLLGVLLVLNMCRRSYVRNVWLVYMVVLALLLPGQYFSALGLPPTLCEMYPWNAKMNGRLSVWLFLPEYINPPPVTLLIVDCLQFLLVALQYRVFKMEMEDNNPVISAAGSNKEFGNKPPSRFKDMHDFVDNKRNAVDVIFSAVFGYWFWICIIVLYITGTQNINLYCFGYLLSCFYFFWHGLDFTIKQKKTIIRTWNAILIYNVVVIFLKTVLQIVGCVVMDVEKTDEGSQCIVPELFSIKCLNSQLTDDQVLCGVTKKDAGLVWDIVCFVVLLIQRRIFMSTYFLVVVCEERSQADLSSRGAELINQLSSRRICAQQKHHKKEMEQIRKKLERIRLKTSRLNGGESRDDWTHFEVIRSGDASMFDEASDDESTIQDSINDDLGEGQGQEGKHNPMKMLVTALDAGLEKSLKQRALSKRASVSQLQDNQGAGASAATTASAPAATTASAPAATIASAPAAADVDVTADKDHGDEEERTIEEEDFQEDDENTAITQIGETAQTTDTWLKEFVVSCIKWIINRLNVISADYRTVASKLDCEQLERKSRERQRMMSVVEDDEEADVTTTASASDIQLEEHEELWQQALEDRSLVYRLGNAIYLALIARTEFICYFTMILCHICNGNILSLPLPLVATLWGMLSIPRPAKTFWVVVLSYVMLVVVIKYLSHFSFWGGDKKTITDWDDPRLLFGVRGDTPVACNQALDDECKDGQLPEKTYYATYELLILLSIFIHRSVLKRYGLWRNESENRQDMKRLASVSGEPTNSVVTSTSFSDSDNAYSVPAQESFADDCEPPSENTTRAYAICGNVVNWYRHISSGKLFFKGDHYAMMVLCDFINFFISVFLFSDFGPPQSGNVQEYISANRIPVFFLIFLLLQFASMVIDRALYLKKSRFGKLAYTVLLIIVIHIYTLFVLSAITQRSFSRNTAAQLWYFIKCVYFGLSAWQIKSGYPHGVLGNFLTTKYSYVNLVLFKAFMICPFLLELRCVMDWMWTKTSMSLTTWLTMEDIFAKTFTIKCFRQGEKEYPTPRAKNRSRLIKYGLGGIVLLLLIFVIWFPLVIFSFANQIYTPNPPSKCQMRVDIGGYQDIFTMRTQANGVVPATVTEVSQFGDLMKKSAKATSFLEQYEAKDISTITLNGESTAIWGITPPSKESLVHELNGTGSIAVTVTLEFTRQPKKGLTAGTVSTEYSTPLVPGSNTRKQLLHLITNAGTTPVMLHEFLPRYIKLGAANQPSTASDLLCTNCSEFDTQIGLMPKDGLTLSLKNSTYFEYWSVSASNSYSQQFPPVFLNKSISSPKIYLVTFNERVAPEAIAIITGSGIIGLYIGMVFVIGQFIRSLTSGGTYTIMFDELPNVDKIMKLCKDLYFVRENGELDLEEELFAKLIFLFRSPNKLIEWTKKTD